MIRRRLFRGGLVAAAVIVLVVAGALAWLIATEAGARYVLSRAVALTDGALSFGSLEGRLRDEIVLTEIRFLDDSSEVTIDEVRIRLNLPAVLAGSVVVEDLRTTLVRYRQTASDAAVDEPAAAFSLPIGIRLERAFVAGVVVEGGDEPVAVERIVLAGEARGTSADVQRFEFRVQGFFVSSQAVIDWQDALDVDAIVSWSGAVGNERWLGSVDVDGSWPDFSFEQEMIEPIEQTAAGSFSLGQAPGFDLRASWPELGEIESAGSFDRDSGVWRFGLAASDLAPRAVVPDWPGTASLSGDFVVGLEAGVSVAGENVHVELTVTDQTAELDLDGSWQDGELTLQRAVAALGSNRIELAGSVGQNLALDLTAQLDDLAGLARLAASPELQAIEPRIGVASSLTGRAAAELRLDGPLAQPSIGGSVRVEDSRFADQMAELDLDGSWQAGELTLQRAVAALGSNRIELAGSVGQNFALDLTAQLDDLAGLARLAASPELQAIEPRIGVASSLTGRAAAELRLDGPLAQPSIGGSVRVEDSRFADLPLTLALEFATRAEDAGAIVIDTFSGTLGTSRLDLSGSVAGSLLESRGAWRTSRAPLNLAIELAAGDLAELAALAERDEVRAMLGGELALPAVSGSASAEIMVSGTVARPDAAIELRLADASLATVVLDAATVNGGFGIYPGGETDFTVSADSSVWSVDLGATGTLTAGGWDGRLQLLTIDEQWLGMWRLDQEAALSFAPGHIAVDGACLRNNDSALCVDGSYGTEGDRLRVTADRFELAALGPLLPVGVSLEGSVMLDAGLGFVGGMPSGSLTASASGVGIELATSETDRVTLVLATLAVGAALDGYALDVTVGLESAARGRADVSLATTDLRDPDAAIAGSVDVAWPDLAALTLLSPEVGQVGGSLSMSIGVAGTAANPELSGNAAVTEGRVEVPTWGLLIDRIEGQAQSAFGRSLQFTGSGFVDDSELSVNGVTELDPATGWPTRLSVRGDNVLVASRDDARVIASPDFDVEVNLPNIAVTGSVFVPEAYIALAELPAQAVRVSSDTVVHGEAESETGRPLDVTAVVDVVLGDDVRYTDSNLDAFLSGRLRLEYRSGRSPLASGTLTLTGSYVAFGQTLELERGELLFAGPLDDPALDLLAVRRIGTTTVGFRLAGSLLTPDTRLFSDPAMSEANALSYLLFGRPLEASDDEQTASLRSTALTLGLQQALPVVQRVGDTLGLDEFSIEPTDVDAGALMAGKYLSPRLYVRYTYGLFNRLGGFLLRYDISDRLSLETRSGQEKSMDLLYSIEKD